MSNALVKEYRGGLLENSYFGAICGVNYAKQIIYEVGDVQRTTFFRSSSKPIQAIPAFLAKVDLKHALTCKETALFTASHRGEKYHIEALESMKAKLDIDENLLYCPASFPLNEVPKNEMLKQHISKRKLFHNCSGKHMGYIATCKELGYPVEGYWQIEHPLQQQILDILAYLGEIKKDDIQVATDNCGVPAFAMPLSHMAISTLKLVRPELIEDSAIRGAIERIVSVMNKEYLMIASHNFICSTLLKDPNIVAKSGAKGVYCFGLKEEKMAFALKVFDGSEDFLPNIIASILEQISYKNKATIDNVKNLKPSIIKTESGIEVGHIETVFKLK